MRVLINYATYADRVTIHCLAEDARTVVAPFKRGSSMETLYRLIKYVGGEPEESEPEESVDVPPRPELLCSIWATQVQQ